MMPLCTIQRVCRANYRHVYTLLPALAAIALLAIAPTAHAGVLTRGLVVWGGFFGTDSGYESSGSSHVEDGYNEHNVNPPGDGLFEGLTDSHADYGTLRAYASATVNSTNYSSQIANSSAIFEDSFTFSGASGVGYAVFTFTVTGSMSPLDADGEGSLFVNNGVFAEFDSAGTYPTFPIGFTFNSPITLAFGLGAVVRFMDVGLTGTAVADFGSTAILTNIQVYEDFGLTQPLEFDLSAESDTQYPLPEPVSALPMLALSLFLRRRTIVQKS